MQESRERRKLKKPKMRKDKFQEYLIKCWLI